jgi:hypothetical protein
MTKFIDGSAGQLSARLIVKDPLTGYDAWLPYDTRLAQTDPAVGKIAIFNSITGLYEIFEDLATAHATILAHRARLTYEAPDTSREDFIAAKLGKPLRSRPLFMNMDPASTGD